VIRRDGTRELLACPSDERGVSEIAKKVELGKVGETGSGAAAEAPFLSIERNSELEVPFGRQRILFWERLQLEMFPYKFADSPQSADELFTPLEMCAEEIDRWPVFSQRKNSCD
jgi:hypothetical protein